MVPYTTEVTHKTMLQWSTGKQGGMARRRDTKWSLTDEGEPGGEDEVHAVAVHGEDDGEVHRQTAPQEKLVHRCPIGRVQAQLTTNHSARQQHVYLSLYTQSQIL